MGKYVSYGTINGRNSLLYDGTFFIFTMFLIYCSINVCSQYRLFYLYNINRKALNPNWQLLKHKSVSNKKFLSNFGIPSVAYLQQTFTDSMSNLIESFSKFSDINVCLGYFSSNPMFLLFFDCLDSLSSDSISFKICEKKLQYCKSFRNNRKHL